MAAQDPPASGRRLDGFLRTGYLIHDVSRLRRMLYDQRSRHLGITRSQWWVLFNLARGDGQPRNQNELAQLLEMGNAAMGELLLRLEKGGFISRQRVAGDRRSKHVQIADRGREVLEHMRLVAERSNDAIMADISAEEQRLLDDLLSRMKRNLAAQIQLHQSALAAPCAARRSDHRHASNAGAAADTILEIRTHG